MLKKFKINLHSVFPDEPPISNYPLWIIKRQIAALLTQNITKEKNKQKQKQNKTPLLCA